MTLETLFKGYIYARVDFSGFVNNMETSDTEFVTRRSVDARGALATGTWPLIFGLSGFVPLKRVFES